MSVRIILGDVRDRLADLSDASVHCAITSPPYWGLRDYGVAGQIGLEESPEAFVAEMVAVFREVRRVLRPDGTLWLNLGDSYAGSGRGGNPTRESSTLEGAHRSQEASMIRRSRGKGETGTNARAAAVTQRGSRLPAGFHEKQVEAGALGRAWVPPPVGLKQKDLVGIPWMVAFALRADGWYLRQDIIWAKPNPMPESVRDRCTKSHEYLFLLSKSERYHFDQNAIAEAVAGDPNAPRNRWDTKDYDVPGQKPQKRLARSGNKVRKPGSARGCPDGSPSNVCGSVPWEGITRNKRSVWSVATSPLKESHFATFPADLVEPCILAGCPRGGVVLDPFGGAGTTGLVADRLGRDAILIELNPEYAEMARRRIQGDAPLLTEVA
ncbi:site-specific DNA-methyltransferase [Ferrovibrio terrae]|uniref:DNA-methyltransferase n=1 Tax=Ferrovibrio terrae TaxID=2594003 RepID=UPI003137EEBD